MPHVPLNTIQQNADGTEWLVGEVKLSSGKVMKFGVIKNLKRRPEKQKKYPAPPPPTPKPIKPEKASGAWRRHKKQIKKETPFVDVHTLNRSYIPTKTCK